MIKQIDKLLIGSFLPPFIVSFFVADFVLVMQMFWLYIDDIAGKGVPFINIMEMIGFLALRMIPQALPVSVLIAAVLVFGSLAERYELTGFKSAGVSLFRMMLPVLFAGVFVALFSLASSEYMIPASNKKFMTRLYDIRKKKPGLSIEEGVFNDDFKEMIIYVGAQDREKGSISDVLIYRKAKTNPSLLHLIRAKRGEMYITKSGAHFVMQLFDGVQYEELPPSKNTKHAFSRIRFKKWKKAMEMSQFELDPSDSELFSSHQASMTIEQLVDRIDSLAYNQRKEMDKLYYDFGGMVRIARDSQYLAELRIREPRVADRLLKAADGKSPKAIKSKVISAKQASLDSIRLAVLDSTLSCSTDGILGALPEEKLGMLVKNARKKAENYERKIASLSKSVERIRDRMVKHIFELHTKYALALACVLFILIGAPMGAIVRKGGFGYPILVSVIFFVIFILSTTSLRRFAEGTEQYDPVFLAWIPNIITLLGGVTLSYFATNDKTMALDKLVQNILSKFKKQP